MTQASRRERKKAATRQALADAALKLFLERGYEDVTVAEIADAADVSVTTLFNHFPDGKPALVFDEADARRDALVAALRERPRDAAMVETLRRHLADQSVMSGERAPQLRRFLELIRSHRALVDYSRRLWEGQEEALAAAMVETDPGRDPEEARALAHLVVDGYSWAQTRPDPPAAFEHVMRLLRE